MVLESTSDKWLHVSGSLTQDGTSQTLIAPVDVHAVDRVSMQFINNATGAATVKVYGTLDNVTGTLGNSRWTQIGDTLTVSGTTSSLKSISTTGLYYIGVTTSGGTSGSSMDTGMLYQSL